MPSNKTDNFLKIELTPSGCEGCKFIFSNGKSSIIMGSDPEVVPGGRVQIQDYKVSSRLDIVADNTPVLLVLGFVLHNKVDDGTASIQPSIQVQGHTRGK